MMGSEAKFYLSCAVIIYVLCFLTNIMTDKDRVNKLNMIVFLGNKKVEMKRFSADDSEPLWSPVVTLNLYSSSQQQSHLL